MPVAKFKMPDGKVARFKVPEGTTPEQAQALIQEHLKNQQTSTPIPEIKDVIGLRGLIQQEHTPEQSIQPEDDPIKAGFSALGTGFANRVRGIGQAGLSVAESLVPDEQFGGAQSQLEYLNALANANLEQKFPENQKSRAVGGFVGDLAALAPAMAAGPAGLIAGGAFGGGLEAFTRPSESSESLTEKGIKTVAGAGAGALTGQALKTGGKIVLKAGEKLGKVFGFADTNISDIFSNLDNYGLQQNVAVEKVGKTLNKEAKRQTRRIGTLYSRARAQQATIPAERADTLLSGFEEILDQAARPDIKDTIINRISSIRKLGKNTDRISIDDIEGIRSLISKDASSTDRVFNKTMMQLANKIDDFVINEDATTGTLWKKAIGARRNYFNKFEEPAEIAALLKTGSTDEIGEILWGAATGAKSKSSGIKNKYLSALPQSQRPQAEFVLKQSLMDKIIKQASRNVEGVDEISGPQVIRTIKLLQNEKPDLWNMFSSEEKIMLTRMSREIQKKGDATSKMGGVMAKMLNRLRSVKNIELPSPIKPKTTYSLEDVISMARTKPVMKEGFTPLIGGEAGAAVSRNIEFE